eukprot:gene1706-66024_t
MDPATSHELDRIVGAAGAAMMRTPPEGDVPREIAARALDAATPSWCVTCGSADPHATADPLGATAIGQLVGVNQELVGVNQEVEKRPRSGSWW